MEQNPMTYSVNQPNNSDAWRLGEACRMASDSRNCGDYIDRGLILIGELELRGYGIVKLPVERPLNECLTPDRRSEIMSAFSSRQSEGKQG